MFCQLIGSTATDSGRSTFTQVLYLSTSIEFKYTYEALYHYHFLFLG